MKTLRAIIQNLFRPKDPEEVKRQNLLYRRDAWPHEIFQRGVANFENGDFEAAINDFSEYIRHKSNNPHAYIYRGRAYWKLHKIPETYSDFLAAIHTGPSCGEAYYWSGVVEVYRIKPDRALEKFDRAIALGFRKAEVYFRRAEIRHYHMKDDERAFADYAEGFKRDPNCDWGYSWRGSFHLELGNLNEALKDFNKSLEIKPNTYALVERSKVHLAQGNFDDAIADCTKFIESFPKSTDAWLNRGIAYKSKGDYPNALADLQQVLKLSPYWPEAEQAKRLIAEMEQ